MVIRICLDVENILKFDSLEACNDNKAALGWLRGRRNAVLHHEGPSDGLMGEAAAMDWQWRDTERGVSALLDYLDDLVRYDVSD